ncbi:MAG: M43 family zinc metalloprotease [Cytophagaceae bacterium]
MRLFVLLGFLFSISGLTNAQRCGFKEYNDQLKKNFADEQKFEEMLSPMRLARTASDSTVYIIPVVVHIIHNNANHTIGGDNNNNITEEQILSQIQVLNEDYRKKPGSKGFNIHPAGADSQIEFCLADRDPDGNSTTGIVRYYYNKTSWGITSSEDRLLKSLSYWPSHQYLNIWVTRLSSGYLGYAQYPSGAGLPGLTGFDEGAETDGVVIDFRAFGTTGTAKAPYHYGRTLTHEVGHWLGLRHIWGDDYCGDDFVTDTPRQEKATTSSTCTSKYSSCGGGLSLDMIENYMDYTGDVCMNIFTKGQKDRMRTALTTAPRRLSLLSSFGCCGDNNAVKLNFREGFEEITLQGWSISSSDNGSPWTRTGTGGFGRSNNSMFVQNPNGEYSYMDSPYLDFTGVRKPVMDFNLAYAKNSFPHTDSLVILYNASCKEEIWVPLATFYGSDLVTTSKTQSSFTPDQNDWKKFRVNLTPLVGKPGSKIRFALYSKAGNNLYIDDINIYHGPLGLNVNIFPNPVSTDSGSEGELTVDILFPDIKNVRIEIFNTVGQKIMEKAYPAQYSFQEKLDVSSFNAGVYIIVVYTDQQKNVKKFIVK